MKHLFTFLSCCLPIYLFAQGFGSFSHDQPYFAKDSSASQPFTPSGSISNISQWWFAGDLTNGSITYWDDRISGYRATNTGGIGLPTKDSNGVHFLSKNTYLKGNGVPIVPANVLMSQSNWMITVIYRPYSTYGTSPNQGAYTEFLSRVSPALDMQADYDNSTVQPRLRINSTLLSSEYNNSGWQTVILVNSNSPNQGCNVYTNGVLSSIATTQYFDSMDTIGRANLDSGNNQIGEISIQEIWVHTNVIDMTPFLAPIQNYVSINYPNITNSTDLEFVTSETLGGEFNTATFQIGFYFVPYYNITVTELGRWDNVGNSQSHTLYLRQKWDNTVLSSTNVTCSGTGDYKYTSITPVTLTAHREYVLETQETSGGDMWRTTSTVTNYYTEGAVMGTAQDHSTYGSTRFQGYGLVNFKYH